MSEDIFLALETSTLELNDLRATPKVIQVTSTTIKALSIESDTIRQKQITIKSNIDLLTQLKLHICIQNNLDPRVFWNCLVLMY